LRTPLLETSFSHSAFNIVSVKRSVTGKRREHDRNVYAPYHTMNRICVDRQKTTA